MSPGGPTSCALRNDGHVLCWGENQLGEVGDGTTITPRLLPVQVVGNANYDVINAGFTHTCGLTVDHLALCWGANEYGQLGRGYYSDQGEHPAGSRAAALRAARAVEQAGGRIPSPARPLVLPPEYFPA